MRTLRDLIDDLHKELDPLALFTRRFAMSIMAIRVESLGWETHCSDYDYRLLLMLAEQIENQDRCIGVCAIARVKAQMAKDFDTVRDIETLIGLEPAKP